MSLGCVEAKSRESPPMVTPVVSVMVVLSVGTELALTLTGVGYPVDPFSAREMFLGGQVKKYPAAEVTLESVALMTVDPGRCAVATPLTVPAAEVSLMLVIETIVESTGV